MPLLLYFSKKYILNTSRLSLLLFTAMMFLAGGALAQQSFVENKGQWHKNVLFKSDFKTGAFFLENNGFTVVMHHPDDLKLLGQIEHGGGKFAGMEQPVKLRSFAYKVKLQHANAMAFSQGEKPLNTYSNFYTGEDAATWASGCREFQNVYYNCLLYTSPSPRD